MTGKPLPSKVEFPPGSILVTGAAGFAGSHLMRELEMGEGDAAVDLTDDFPAPAGVRKVAWRLPSPHPDELGAFRCIVHLAAISSVSGTMNDMRRAFEVNLMGTISVLEYAAARCPGARILLVSSAEVYRPSPRPMDEDWEIGPINPYGSSKASAEITAFQMAGNHGLDLVIARPFPHLGPGQSENFALPSFCRRIISARREGTRSIRVGNLSPVRDYLYVSDVVRAYRCILGRGGSGSVYNVCSGTGCSMADMVMMLMDIAGVSLELEADPELTRPVDVEFQVGDPSRIRSQLGWSPEVDRIEGMRRLFSWWEART
ncbi:MAG: GDP-mannose 4,6-dehydratase [Candidatus Aegiribacteria sp.]